MRNLSIGALILGFGICFVGAFNIQSSNPTTADFMIKCALAIGTLSAVLFALFGDYLREKLDPITVQMEVPEVSNNIFDGWAVGGTPYTVYFHHLRVINKTSHKPIKECRVWLKQIFVQDVNGEWKEEFKFAVPRMMEWAPFEYSKDKRTFCTHQIFDFGKTYEKNLGFELTIAKEQGGAFKRKFQVGTKVKFIFYVTADNYQAEKRFGVLVDVLPSVPGQLVTPSIVTMTKV